MRAATEGSLPLVMPQGNLVEVLGREVRQGSPGELMVESSPSRQRRPPCKINKEMSDEAADAAALTYLLLILCSRPFVLFKFPGYTIIELYLLIDPSLSLHPDNGTKLRLLIRQVSVSRPPA